MDTLEPFRIATIALAGGGRIGISRIPGRNDSYDGDLQAISDWGAHTVVSMTDRSEMVARGCEDLGLRLAARGIGWFHFPIRDFGGPTGGGLVEWPGLSAQLHEILDDRGAVLVHCHGGHGRAGMVALRLLVERSEAPEAALKRIRAVRPGAVQTDAQYRWAASAAE